MAHIEHESLGASGFTAISHLCSYVISFDNLHFLRQCALALQWLVVSLSTCSVAKKDLHVFSLLSRQAAFMAAWENKLTHVLQIPWVFFVFFSSCQRGDAWTAWCCQPKCWAWIRRPWSVPWRAGHSAVITLFSILWMWLTLLLSFLWGRIQRKIPLKYPLLPLYMHVYVDEVIISVKSLIN